MDVIATKNLKTFASCYSQSPPPAYFTPPPRMILWFSCTWDFYRKSFICIITLFTIESSMVISRIHFIYLYSTVVHFETTIRNASKWGKPDRKPYATYGFRNIYKTINQRSLFMNSISWISSSLRNINEIVLSWIPSLVTRIFFSDIQKASTASAA